MKILTFEGAGWSEAESNNVGNCRVRTWLRNDKGIKIYLELTGTEVGKYHGKYYRDNFKWLGHISHIFKEEYEETNHDPELSKLKDIEYTTQDILKLVNDSLNCSFQGMQVLNEGYRCHDEGVYNETN